MIAIMSAKTCDVAEPRWSEPALAEFDARLRKAALVLQRPAGAALFRVDEKVQRMFYVRSGEALMYRVTPSGAPVPFQRAKHGFLAEASLTTERYHCDAVCLSRCELLSFPLRALRAAIDSDEATRWAWIALLSAQARQQRTRIERMALKTVRERLRHLLHAEGESGGYELPGTRRDLAAEIGVTPEALYRALSTLQTEGTLLILGRHFQWREARF